MARSRRNVPQPKEHSALSIDNVSKSYGTAPALDPISFDINTGDRVALIGHNGSGKTTLIRIAAGLLDSSTGSVSIGGAPSGSLSARAALSFIADQPTFYDDLSLWEHLEFIARLHGVDEWDQLAADLLDHLGLYERADELPNRFSRGLRQKAAIAIAFIRPFELMLVDEPFVGLDADVCVCFQRLQRQGECFVFHLLSSLGFLGSGAQCVQNLSSLRNSPYTATPCTLSSCTFADLGHVAMGCQ